MKPASTSGLPFYKQLNIFNDQKTFSLLAVIRKCVDQLMHHKKTIKKTIYGK